MSNQEGMFANAEQQTTYEPRPINADPREQAQRREAPQEEQNEEYGGYRGYAEPGEQQRGGGKVYPEQRPKSRRRSRWPIIAIVILAILFATGFLNSRAWGYAPGLQTTRTFQTPDQTPNLVIADPSGNVRVHTGNTTGVTITATQSSSLFGNKGSVQYRQEGDTIDVTAPGGFLLGGSVDLDITVASTANIQVRDVSGDIAILGTDGNVIAQDISGDINISGVQQGTLVAKTDSGDIQLSSVDQVMTAQSDSGDITARNVGGQMVATTASGDIEVRNSSLNGQSLLKSGSGDVTFSGSLDNSGSYQMQSDSGDVSVALPPDAAFQLTTQTASGSISNDFGSNDVGNPNVAHPLLQISTGSGDIHINRRGF